MGAGEPWRRHALARSKKAGSLPRKPETKHTLNISEGFLKLLEDIEERGKRERRENKQLLIDRANAVDAEVV